MAKLKRLTRGKWIFLLILIAAVVLILIIARAVGKRGADPTARGLELLDAQASRNTADIESEIKEARKERDAADAALTTPEGRKARYEGAVIVGDSVAEGLIDYDILPNSSVVAHRGASVKDSDEAVATVISLAPSYVILDFGLNDLDIFAGDPDGFIAAYQSVYERIKEGLPQAKFGFCLVTPVPAVTVSARPQFQYQSAFDDKIIAFCENENIPYIETADLVTEYESDNLHPASSFYGPFADRIANAMGF